MKQVLMVCTGNICRSPTAEGVLRAKLAQAGLAGSVQVESCGIEGYHAGDAPDKRALRSAAARGYDLSAQVARKLRDDDFQRFDWILGMDAGHMRVLQRKCPVEMRGKLSLLMDFTDTPGVEVPDPYYGAPAAFERVLDLVEAGCDGLVKRLRTT